MSSKKRIDVHHHLIPPAFVQAMDKYGLKTVAVRRCLSGMYKNP